MQKTIKIFSLFLLLLIGASQSFAQNQIELQVSLLRWQANSPVQVVGAAFGKDAIIDEVFLYNSSSTAVGKIQIAGLVFAPEKHLSKNINDFLVLESAPIEVAVPPQHLVHLEKTSLWSYSELSQFIKTSKSESLIVRLGISTSVSENNLVFDSSLKQQRSFERANVGDAEYNRINDSWQQNGYKQLLKSVEQSIKFMPAKASKNCSLVIGDQDCTRNKFNYDTTWCQRVNQNSCRTFQCEGTGFCPKDSCNNRIVPPGEGDL